MLKAHKAAQAAERLHAGNQRQDSGQVFSTEFGGPVDLRNMLRT
jgi:integrase